MYNKLGQKRPDNSVNIANFQDFSLGLRWVWMWEENGLLQLLFR